MASCDPETAEPAAVSSLSPQLCPEPAEAKETVNTWVHPAPGEGACFRCLWTDCVDTFADDFTLTQHLSGSHGLQAIIKGASTDAYECGVVGCSMICHDPDRLIRHLHFHEFQAIRQLHGLALLRAAVEEGDLQCMPERCGFPSALGSDYSGEVLECCWGECTDSFDSTPEFLAHVKRHLDLMPPPAVHGRYPCFWHGCTDVFSKKTALRLHVQYHSGEKQCACPYCGGFFSCRLKMINHMFRRISSANNQGRLICFLCQKTFATQSLLRQHGRRHIKNYRCRFCELTVDSPSELQQHELVRHAAQRPFQCLEADCTWAFAKKSDLRRHAISHQKEWPHECSVCGKKFKTKNSLTSHVKIMHKPLANRYSHVCHLCPDARFIRGAVLSRHLIKEHRITVPAGFTRFQYKKCADGYMRLQTDRYESERLAAQMDAARKGQCAVAVTGCSGITTVYRVVQQEPPTTNTASNDHDEEMAPDNDYFL